MSGAESGAIEFVFLRQEEFRGSRLKTFHDVVRNGVHELDYIAFT